MLYKDKKGKAEGLYLSIGTLSCLYLDKGTMWKNT
jgi:hypothetical protein